MPAESHPRVMLTGSPEAQDRDSVQLPPGAELLRKTRRLRQVVRVVELLLMTNVVVAAVVIAHLVVIVRRAIQQRNTGDAPQEFVGQAIGLCRLPKATWSHKASSGARFRMA